MTLPYLRRVVLVLLFGVQAGCATVHDGAYEQVEGRYIDPANFAALVEGTTTPDEALALFGPADSREALAQGYDQFSWHSVRESKSTTRVGGVEKKAPPRACARPCSCSSLKGVW